MNDRFSSELRSAIMSRIRSNDTGPELSVRRFLHANGYRYRLHRKDLPGKPDIVFPSRRCALFVHGCFWHGHHCQQGVNQPKSRKEYWVPKISKNRLRDERAVEMLQDQGWRVLVLWECEIRQVQVAQNRIVTFLGPKVFSKVYK